ncbi:MAG TPA: transporter, partial [Betaproteobacteria bacterium]|nr:transporter [Betaproteobacteria bacterium]
GMTRIAGRQWVVAAHVIQSSVNFSNQGSHAAPGTPLTGGDGGDAGAVSLLPTFYYTQTIAPRLKFGIGVTAPFGLLTQYDNGWKGRYHGLKSQLQTLDINPALGYRLDDRISLGAGVSFQYMRADLTKAIDFGTICGGACGAPQSNDGLAKLSGGGWGVGFNLGALFIVTPATRLGVAYRSRIEHHVRGTASYRVPANIPAAIAYSPAFRNTGASADVTVPDSLSMSAFHQMDRRWALMGDVTWTHWRLFKELRVRFDNGAPDDVTPENWRNTYRVALGVNYRQDSVWLWRAGLAYDQTPVPDRYYRTPRTPDADRVWLAFGVNYRLSGGAALDIGYAHLFMKTAPLNDDAPFGGHLAGDYRNQANILGVQYSRTF